MNLVNDLGSDIALAVVSENKYRENLRGGAVFELISRVRAALERYRHDNDPEPDAPNSLADSYSTAA